MGDDPFRLRSSGGKRVIMGTKALKAKLIEKKKENRFGKDWEGLSALSFNVYRGSLSPNHSAEDLCYTRF